MHKRFTWIYSFGIFAFKSTLFILNCATLKWMSCQNRENYNIYSLLLNWILKNWTHFLWLINLNAFMQVSTTHSLCLFLLQLGKRFLWMLSFIVIVIVTSKSRNSPLPPPPFSHWQHQFQLFNFHHNKFAAWPRPRPSSRSRSRGRSRPRAPFQINEAFPLLTVGVWGRGRKEEVGGRESVRASRIFPR